MAVTAATLARVRAERRALARFSHVVLNPKGAVRNGRIVMLAGVSQHVVPVPPETCTKCGSSEIFQDSTEVSRVSCFSCASDWYVVCNSKKGSRIVQTPA